jgi:peptide/nickel transport system permease protein
MTIGYGTETAARAVRAPAVLREGIERLARVPIGLILAWAVVATVLLWAVAPWAFTSYSATVGVPGTQLRAPSLDHLFGTDALGRDLFARIVFGSVQSLTGAVVAVGVGLLAGTALGLVAGTRGGWVDATVMRFVDTLLAIPQLLLSLSIIILLGFGTINAAVAVGVASIAAFARLSRAEVVRVRRADYVEAAIGSGGTFAAVLWRHVLPNAMTTLGFLGYGAPPPTPEWGLLIAEGRNYLSRAWWLTAAPGLVVVAVVLSANRIGHALQGERR